MIILSLYSVVLTDSAFLSSTLQKCSVLLSYPVRNSGSSKISLVSFRTFKPVTGLELFLAISFSKPALVQQLKCNPKKCLTLCVGYVGCKYVPVVCPKQIV